MTGAQFHSGRSRATTTCLIRLLLATLTTGGTCFATGFFGPHEYLSRSEERIQVLRAELIPYEISELRS